MSDEVPRLPNGEIDWSKIGPENPIRFVFSITWERTLPISHPLTREEFIAEAKAMLTDVAQGLPPEYLKQLGKNKMVNAETFKQKEK